MMDVKKDIGAFGQKVKRKMDDYNNARQYDKDLSLDHKLFNRLAREFCKGIIVDDKPYNDNVVFISTKKHIVEIVFDGFFHITVKYELSEWGLNMSKTYVMDIEKYDGLLLKAILSTLEQMNTE